MFTNYIFTIRTNPVNFNFVIENYYLNIDSHVKDLGVILFSDFTFNEHNITVTCNKATRIICF